MAEDGKTEDEKKRFPKMPANSWWALRKRLHTTMPAKLTASYLASALNMSQDSANNNILPSLRITGLIDDDGKPTERAVKWRDDAQYPQVCKEIREEVYPQELLDLAPDATSDRATINSWVANHLRVGANAAGKITSFYALLSEADPSKGNGSSNNSANESRSKPKETPRPKSTTKAAKSDVTDDVVEQTPPAKDEKQSVPQKQPSVHIDVQIHISPESSPEQIDQIFASMAKHLKDFS